MLEPSLTRKNASNFLHWCHDKIHLYPECIWLYTFFIFSAASYTHSHEIYTWGTLLEPYRFAICKTCWASLGSALQNASVLWTDIRFFESSAYSHRRGALGSLSSQPPAKADVWIAKWTDRLWSLRHTLVPCYVSLLAIICKFANELI